MHINNQDEALKFVDTQIRQNWMKIAQQNELLKNLELGIATIEQETEFDGHRAWQFHIEGLPMSRDNRKRWVLDTGETVETTLKEDENTLEKAYAKLQRLQDESQQPQDD